MIWKIEKIHHEKSVNVDLLMNCWVQLFLLVLSNLILFIYLRNCLFIISLFSVALLLLIFISLTHWGQVTHICVGNLTIIGSDNGLSPDLRQAIILTNAGILLIGPLGTNFSEFLIEIQTFSFKKMRLKVSSAKWRPFYLSLNVLNVHLICTVWHVTLMAITGITIPVPYLGDKMGDIFQTTFWNVFSWIKIVVFWLKFHWKLFPRVQLTVFQHWFR